MENIFFFRNEQLIIFFLKLFQIDELKTMFEGAEDDIQIQFNETIKSLQTKNHIDASQVNSTLFRN